MFTFALQNVKTDGSHTPSDKANTVGCVNNLLHSMFSKGLNMEERNLLTQACSVCQDVFYLLSDMLSSTGA